MYKPVPHWRQLPLYVQTELGARGYGRDWFDKQDDKIRLTVLNLFVKLRGMKLWQFVQRRASTSVGCLEFFTSDAKRLKQELTNRWNFRSPEDSSNEWDSAEKRATGALHFKHFQGWPANKVQAHVDAAGNWLGHPWLWWSGQPVTGLRHLAGYDSFKDVQRIRDILLEQGWDRQPLTGGRR